MDIIKSCLNYIGIPWAIELIYYLLKLLKQFPSPPFYQEKKSVPMFR